jgi:hypothetical protein
VRAHGRWSEGKTGRGGANLGLVAVDVHRTEDENETREGSVRRDGLEPIVVEIEENHLGLGSPQNEITKLLDLETLGHTRHERANLKASLEGELQLGTLDDDVGEVQQVHLEGIEHAFTLAKKQKRMCLRRRTHGEIGGEGHTGRDWIPFRVTTICLGCSSTGSERIRAATSSAVFHLASCPRRFWPAHTDVWMILRKSWPVRGLKMKMAPLMGLVVKLPSNVLWIVTRYTLVSSTNYAIRKIAQTEKWRKEKT